MEPFDRPTAKSLYFPAKMDTSVSSTPEPAILKSQPKNKDENLEEVVGHFNGFVLSEDKLQPVFCKPKLLSMKTVILEKLQKMQQATADKQEAAEKTEVEVSHSFIIGLLKNQFNQVNVKEPTASEKNSDPEINIWKPEG
ncbi:hypothetical protein L596_010603 [Steinernema carpocapsae]|uniref:Uncharacterized protein n=1 Tax=Steinernema carpocapsae TaxID=34508 RepID=A0A4V6A6Y0_STECR|nr:hypothetical protein L596_010603 [Steinernema carpocapsae]